jgi:hypothetical protein
MEEKDPTPQTTLLILLGASEWPSSPHFQSSEASVSKAFANAAQGVRDYFCNPQPFGLPTENLLDLFDSGKGASELDQQIEQFLKQRLADMTARGSAGRDLLLYFIGHGGFAGDDHDYYLAIRSTGGNLLASGLGVKALAYTVKEEARHLRRIIILDCCFAAAAFHSFQGASDQVAIEKTIDAFRGGRKAEGLPKKGTTLFCSSNQKSPSQILANYSSTMFTKAFLDVLTQGTYSQQERLTLREVKDAARDLLFEMQDAPKPVLDSPDQSEGDIADIPFFPNPKIEEERRKRAEEERIRQAAVERAHKEEERIHRAEEQAPKFAEEEQSGQTEEEQHPRAEEVRLREIQEAAVRAQAHGDMRTAYQLWQRLATSHDVSDNIYVTTAREHLQNLRSDFIACCVKLAGEAYMEGQWQKEIDIWEELLALQNVQPEEHGYITLEQFSVSESEMDSRQIIQERIKIARDNMQCTEMYEKATQFVKESDLLSAKTQLEILWSHAHYYGDPKGLAKLTDMKTPPNYEQTLQAKRVQMKKRERWAMLIAFTVFVVIVGGWNSYSLFWASRRGFDFTSFITSFIISFFIAVGVASAIFSSIKR